MAGATQETEGLGAVVLAYGPGRMFETVIDSLFAAGVTADEIVLVHNAAQRGEVVPEAPAGVEVIGTGRNLGYAGGMNVGIARMRERGTDLVLLLTHDAALRQGALTLLRATLRAVPRLGLTGPALLYGGSERAFSFGGVTSSSGLNRHLKEPRRVGPDGVSACDWVDGGTLLVRGEVLGAVGGFDERFWSYCEEADLCLRVRRAGWEVGVVPAARADQEPGAVKRPGVWAYLMTRNGIEYARRAKGFIGLTASLLRANREAARAALRALLRALRLRQGSAREPLYLAVGIVRGELDFLRRRWGPPPAGLPGSGDVGNL